MSPSPFFCFYCRVPNNLQCRINSPPGSPARHKSPRQMHVRIACVQVLLQYIHIYYTIYYLRIVYAQFLYNIYCNMLKEDFSRRRTFIVCFIIVISCFTALWCVSYRISVSCKSLYGLKLHISAAPSSPRRRGYNIRYIIFLFFILFNIVV